MFNRRRPEAHRKRISLYTFDDAAAKDRHTTQSSSSPAAAPSIRTAGGAGTRHGDDGVLHVAHVPFDQDVWELYDMSNDFGHATNIPAVHAGKAQGTARSSRPRSPSTTSIR